VLISGLVILHCSVDGAIIDTRPSSVLKDSRGELARADRGGMAAEVPRYIVVRTANNLHSSAVGPDAVCSVRDPYAFELRRLMRL
jgi:hypothetical protein